LLSFAGPEGIRMPEIDNEERIEFITDKGRLVQME